MVKNSAEQAGRRSTFTLIFFLTFLILNLTGCNSVPAARNATPAEKESWTVVEGEQGAVQKATRQDSDIFAVPAQTFIKSKLSDHLLLAVKSDLKDIYTYDVEKQSLTKFLAVKNSDKFIKKIVSNTEWIVWLETEDLVLDTGNKSFQWQMVGHNVRNGEEIILDQSSFRSNDYDIPLPVNYTPDDMAISKENKVVYCRTDIEDSKIISEVILYDLNAKSKSVIVKAGDVHDELIATCGIYGDSIVWNKFYGPDGTEQRLTWTLYSDLYLYNLRTQKTERLTVNDYYYDPCLYENRMAAIHIPLKEEGMDACNTEIVMANLEDKTIKTVVDENSPCYDVVENQMVRHQPRINNRYISWYNNAGSGRFIFDYQKNQFLEVYDGATDTPDNTMTIWEMFDNYVMMYINNDDKEKSKTLMIDMREI
ncbi:hypothetical protein Sgly_2749 [Syntrophobotulus glycolicus DSM 8271]|uniref:Uncharacterized protein n=1 Tax=Syntrophobotulus glycolicus (strain DSM 8271 / FlGlyR) TaxID=645991 RepID=F0SXW1_SYNGF|nr:hypothetical protein [Syntrophobotulus glycolicus]ADY57022.1 hypothetical protein Sgly_2749 [Syntrophobotulus glycolicus DSM 8271]